MKLMSPFIYSGLKTIDAVNYQRSIRNYSDVIYFICIKLSVSVDDVKSKSRKKKLSEARHICCYFLRLKLKLPVKKIGSILGNRDHSTVISSINVIKGWMETDKKFKEIINQIDEEL